MKTRRELSPQFIWGVVAISLVVVITTGVVLVEQSLAGTSEEVTQQTSVLYVNVESENLRISQNGEKIGTVIHGTPLNVLEIEGNWAKVQLTGWIWRPSTTNDRSSLAVTTSASPISIVSFTKVQRAENYDANRYQPDVVLTLLIKNNTSQIVKAWRAVLIVNDPFGEELFKVQLTSGQANIGPSATKEARFVWEDNPFIAGESYDNLVAYSTENLKLELTEIQVVH